MIENSEQEKETNIINSINSIKISELENNTKNQNIPQEFKSNQITNNNDIINDNITSDNTNTTVSNENNNNNKEVNLIQGKNISSEIKNIKKENKGIGYNFPITNTISQVEIPFTFQQNLNSQKNNCLHSYITMKDVPKLIIDISDEKKMENFLVSNNIESLKETNQKTENNIKSIDNDIMQYKNKNEILREEIEKMKRDLLISNQNIDYSKKYLAKMNLDNNKIINEINEKLNDKNKLFENLNNNYKNIEKEIAIINNNNKENKKNILNKIKEQINTIQKINYNNIKYYKNKFVKNIIITEEYIYQILKKDLIDFMNLVKYKISIIKPKVNELINFIQNSVEKSIGNEYEIKLYGSHATGLCLPWSDIDVVLCKKNKNAIQNENNSYSNKFMVLHDLFTYLQKNNDFKSINYIGATSVPLIKIKTKENIDIKNVDISLQDNTHYGIKCVTLVLNYIKEYEVLLPMVLALKNILKQANLNDPYTVSIYIFI